MTNAKRLVAFLLAFVMAASMTSILGYAGGTENQLTVTSQIGMYNDGVWTPVDEVVPGDEVAVRVFLKSDFYSTSAQLAFFYSDDFFTESYSEEDKLTMGAMYSKAPYDYRAYINGNTALAKADMVATGQISQSVANANKLLIINVYGTSTKAAKFVDTQYLAELKLTVKSDATGKGDFFVIPETVATPANQNGLFVISKGDEGSVAMQCEDSYNWQMELSPVDDSVTIMQNPVYVTFDACGGNWNKNVVCRGSAGTALVAPEAPKKLGKVFDGWATNAQEESGSEVTVYPATSTTYFAIWKDSPDAGKQLVITTKFFREEGGKWIETTRAKKGDKLKARVYLATDYYTNSGELLFFYDKTFFENDYNGEEGFNTLAVNTDLNSYAAQNGVEGFFYTEKSNSEKITKLVENGYLPAGYANDNNYFLVSFRNSTTGNAMLFDDADFVLDDKVTNDYWLCEFELTVKQSATLTGDLIVEPGTIANPTTAKYGVVNIPKGAQGEYDNNGMWLWNASVTLISNPVSLESTLTFDPNEGTQIISGKSYTTAEPYTVSGEIGGTVDTGIITEPTYKNHVFLGWYDKADEEKTIVSVPNTLPYEDTVYVAMWSDEIAVKFETFGGTTIAPVTGAAGADFNANIADPTKEGYTFGGWSLTKSGNSGVAPSASLPTVFPDKETVYYAIWIPENYTADFYLINGKTITKIASTPIAYGTVIGNKALSSLTTVPEGYDAEYWFDDATCTAKLDESATMPAEKIALFAKLDPKSVNITFRLTEGEGTFSGGELQKVVPAPYGEKVILPENPTRDGYSFVGWSPAPDTVTDLNGMEFTPIWQKVQEGSASYYLYFYYKENGAYPANPNVITEVSGNAVGTSVVLDVTPDDGYALDTENSQLSGVIPATGTLILKVYLCPNNFDFTWYGNGIQIGGKNSDTVSVPFGTVVNAPAGEVTAGYDLIGWATTQQATTPDVTFAFNMPAKNVDVYAVYKLHTYSLTFDPDGGTLVKDTVSYTTENPYVVNVDAFAAITTFTEVPQKQGYSFEGWDFNGDGIADSAFPTNMGTEDIAVKAIWKSEKYTVTYMTWVRDAAEGSATYGKLTATAQYEQYECTAGEAMTKPTQAPSVEYYNFLGWSEWADNDAEKIVNLPDEMGSDDAIFYAVFERIPVYLAPAKGADTQISRGSGFYGDGKSFDGVVRNNGTVNTYSETAYDKWAEGTENVWYIYGLDVAISENNLDAFFQVNGDGYYTVTSAFRSAEVLAVTPIGTGTVVKVFDKVTGEQVEEFVMVIFGDINGDSRITAPDINLIKQEAAWVTAWSVARSANTEFDSAKYMAGDLNHNFGTVDATDCSIACQLLSKIVDVDQANGKIF